MQKDPIYPVFTDTGLPSKDGPEMAQVITARRRAQQWAKIPGVRKILSIIQRIDRKVEPLRQISREIENDAARLRVNGSNSEKATVFGSGFGYIDPAEETKVARKYEAEILHGREWRRESGHVYALAIKDIANLIRETGSKQVINFGVSYAFVDAALARHFPDVKFIGIDRAPSTKAYNDERFSLSNLEFVAADVMEWLSANRCDNSILVHIRTAALLPKNFMDSLYAMAFNSGIRQIYAIEPYGFSREIDDFFSMSDDDVQSIGYRNMMIIHNYHGILKKTGFKVTENRYIKTTHQDPDYRLQVFHAHRRDETTDRATT